MATKSIFLKIALFLNPIGCFLAIFDQKNLATLAVITWYKFYIVLGCITLIFIDKLLLHAFHVVTV